MQIHHFLNEYLKHFITPLCKMWEQIPQHQMAVIAILMSSNFKFLQRDYL